MRNSSTPCWETNHGQRSPGSSWLLPKRALKLYPWQQPPCDADEDGDDGEINGDGVKLLRKMLAAGLTRYEPDPLAALEAVKRKGAA